MTNEAYPSTLCNRQHFKSNKSNGKIDIIQTKNKTSHFLKKKISHVVGVLREVGVVKWLGWSNGQGGRDGHFRVVNQSGHYGLI